MSIREPTVAIIGVGLIGGSIGLALRKRGLAKKIVGVGRNPASLAKAQQVGAIDAAATNLATALHQADIAVVCTPVTRIAEDVIACALHAKNDVLITDAGSVKHAITLAVEADPIARGLFVAAHPIAGSEQTGVAHARADLFDDRVCVLTPSASTQPDRLQQARDFWAGMGCRLIEVSPEEHDTLIAFTSHLPHAVAAALAASAPAQSLPMAGPSFRDGTRVVASPADLWAAIFQLNQGPLLKAIKSFREQLDTLAAAIDSGDQDPIRDWWLESQNKLKQGSVLFKSDPRR